MTPDAEQLYQCECCSSMLLTKPMIHMNCIYYCEYELKIYNVFENNSLNDFEYFDSIAFTITIF